MSIINRKKRGNDHSNLKKGNGALKGNNRGKSLISRNKLIIIAVAAVLLVAFLIVINAGIKKQQPSSSTTLPGAMPAEASTTIPVATTLAAVPTSTTLPVATTLAGQTATTLSGNELSPTAEGGKGKVHYVDIVSMKFEPAVISIDVGDTVVWTNKDQTPYHDIIHMLKAHSGEFMSPRLYYNSTFSHTFSTAGEYTYIDSIFPKTMRNGIVKAGQASPLTGAAVMSIHPLKTPLISVLIIISVFAVLVGYMLGFRTSSQEAKMFD
jgi:plastocyanin